MKRLFIILTIMALPCMNVKAQENKYEAKLGWTPVDALNLIYMMGEDPSGETSYGPMKTAGIFSADFDFRMKRWLSVGPPEYRRHTPDPRIPRPPRWDDGRALP